LIRAAPGNVSLETMLVEISKLEAIRAIGLPAGLFTGIDARIVAGWRARAAVESPVHLREHPHPTKLALLCALLHLREREVTDALAQLLISTVHRINARSEEKVITELVKDFKRVTGKETLLRKIAEASLGTPDDTQIDAFGETRFLMLLQLPPMPGHGDRRTKNGPALAGHGAEAVRDAIAAAITTLPEQLRRSLTWDQGSEMSQHAQLRIDTGLTVYFCDPHSPWQRGSNENTNGLLRQYFPKGTDLTRHTPEDLAAVAATLNSRPRKTLGWKTPTEALNDHLLSPQPTNVATTD
ncbi:MAG: IS30 family transposase, partial [Solirubrobacteraceae bacterium]